MSIPGFVCRARLNTFLQIFRPNIYQRVDPRKSNWVPPPDGQFVMISLMSTLSENSVSLISLKKNGQLFATFVIVILLSNLQTKVPPLSGAPIFTKRKLRFTIIWFYFLSWNTPRPHFTALSGIRYHQFLYFWRELYSNCQLSYPQHTQNLSYLFLAQDSTNQQPDRPIVSACSCPTKLITNYLDSVLLYYKLFPPTSKTPILIMS